MVNRFIVDGASGVGNVNKGRERVIFSEFSGYLADSLSIGELHNNCQQELAEDLDFGFR